MKDLLIFSFCSFRSQYLILMKINTIRHVKFLYEVGLIQTAKLGPFTFIKNILIKSITILEKLFVFFLKLDDGIFPFI